MASKELLRTVKQYERHIELNGLDEQVVNAYVLAVQSALIYEKDIDYGLELGEKAKDYIRRFIKERTGGTFEQLEMYAFENNTQYDIVNKYYNVLMFESFYRFESFCFTMERFRHPSKRFYAPRRKTLHVVAQDLQDLEDNKLKFLGVSLPSRTGKSTLCIFFLAWVAMSSVFCCHVS